MGDKIKEENGALVSIIWNFLMLPWAICKEFQLEKIWAADRDLSSTSDFMVIRWTEHCEKCLFPLPHLFSWSHSNGYISKSQHTFCGWVATSEKLQQVGLRIEFSSMG